MSIPGGSDLAKPRTHDFSGRRVLVTGAGTGIGLSIGRAFALAGATTIFHFHTSRASLDRELAELAREGASVNSVQVDLSAPRGSVHLVDTAATQMGGLDILVNCAAETTSLPIDDETTDHFERLVWINLGSVLFGIQRAVPYLETSPAPAVVNIVSPHAVLGLPDHSAYAATKAGVIGLTRQVAIELAPRGIRVNAVGPGLVEVPRLTERPTFDLNSSRMWIPLGRVGQPSDISSAVLFLASESASWVTGHVLWVDGGTTARMGFDQSDGKQIRAQLGARSRPRSGPLSRASQDEA
jgi:glucose 1-dehydrogenase